MSDLIPVVPFPVSGSNAILLELGVDPQSAPYLVTAPETTSGLLMWIPRSSKERKARSVIRSDIPSKEDLFKAIVSEIMETGESAAWGNVHPLTSEGVQAAVDYLAYFGLEDVELLANPATEGLEDLVKDGVAVLRAAWCPEGMVVVVPKDREFFGFAGKVREGALFCMVHNPSRGLAVARR